MTNASLSVLRNLGVSIALVFATAVAPAQTKIPEWCRPLPRPEYKTLERVSISDPWFEVYKPAQGVFAIYEPHQAEKTISYLIVGEKQALLFDTGMGIGNLKKVVAQLTKLPIILLNSHTQMHGVLGWTRRQKSRQARYVVRYRRAVTRKPTQPGPGRSR